MVERPYTTLPANRNYFNPLLKQQKSPSFERLFWSGCWDLNPGPPGPKPGAIANFATARYFECRHSKCPYSTKGLTVWQYKTVIYYTQSDFSLFITICDLGLRA